MQRSRVQVSSAPLNETTEKPESNVLSVVTSFCVRCRERHQNGTYAGMTYPFVKGHSMGISQIFKRKDRKSYYCKADGKFVRLYSDRAKSMEKWHRLCADYDQSPATVHLTNVSLPVKHFSTCQLMIQQPSTRQRCSTSSGSFIRTARSRAVSYQYAQRIIVSQSFAPCSAISSRKKSSMCFHLMMCDSSRKTHERSKCSRASSLSNCWLLPS